MTVIYVDGYMNSLRNVILGSIYINDIDDWNRANRAYSFRDSNNGQTFDTTGRFLSTSGALYPGSYTVRLRV
jgi:hypothetical protein